MNDQQLGPLISDWLKAQNRPPPDSATSVRTAMDAATKTRQLRRRPWLPPFVHRLPDPPTASRVVDQTIDYAPAPIPASNGPTPTAIGRTQPMFSPVKAITAGAIVFALGGLFLAQPFAQQEASAPGATTDSDLMRPASVNGEFTAFGSGNRLSITVDASDPRLQSTGVYDSAFWLEESDDPEAEPGEIVFGTWELTNDEGGWIGTGAEIDVGFEASVLELEGHGAYDGLTASLVMRWGPTGFTFEGAIVPDELFPAPQSTATQ